MYIKLTKNASFEAFFFLYPLNYQLTVISWLKSLIDIFFLEIKNSLKRGERVEFRGFGTWTTHTQKARISRNPKTGEKVHTPQKKTIYFKMAKELFNKLNDNE